MEMRAAPWNGYFVWKELHGNGIDASHGRNYTAMEMSASHWNGFFEWNGDYLWKELHDTGNECFALEGITRQWN
jgi:hypothetical protein